jgi:hypothetical protein
MTSPEAFEEWRRAFVAAHEKCVDLRSVVENIEGEIVDRHAGLSNPHISAVERRRLRDRWVVAQDALRAAEGEFDAIAGSFPE